MAILCRVLIAVSLTAPLAAQTSTLNQQRLADVQFVATQLPALHANFFFQLNPADFNAAVQSLTARIPNLTPAEFEMRLAQLVAMAGDPHTWLYPPGATFSLTFVALDDGIFVTGAPPEYAQALGMQLVAVGNTDIATVLTQLGTVIPHTNPQWVRFEAQLLLRYQDVLQGLDLAPSASSTPMTFQDPLGNRVTMNVAPSTEAQTASPSTLGPLPEFVRSASQNYWFTYFAPQRLLYFRYNVCEDNPANPFAGFAANLLATFDANPIDSFVFDFRGNTGGDSSVINPLLAGLQQRLPAALENPKFRVYDVIDEGTFSSGLDDAMGIKSGALVDGVGNTVVVIGEPSGGPPAGYGEVVGFTLPYLGLSGQYSTVYHPLQPDIPAGTAFNPDIPVANRSTDYFARQDPVLAAIFARAGAPPAAPAGATIVVNAANFRTDKGIAPGSYAAAFGTFPPNVDGVFISGVAAQIVIATPSQINFILPVGVIAGTAAISVRAGATEVSKGQFTVSTSGLGIFVLSTDLSQPGAVLNPDYSVNTSANPAARNSIVQIYGTGFAQSTQIFFGNVPATVLYSGPVPGVAGLWQINATVPAGMTGQLPVFAIADNTVSNTVTVWVK